MMQGALITVAAICAGALSLTFLWMRMPLYRWSCRHCKRVVSSSRFHPGPCTCGENTLVANFCKRCGSWNTSPTPRGHCVACSSSDVSLAVEYHFRTRFWRMRNRNPRRSYS
jgi:hypothetical protein